VTNDQIKHMVDRFLGWKLPENFSPDAGISFKATFNEHTDYPMKHEPSGTNLLDATQAEAMVRYMIEGMSEPTALAARLAEVEAALRATRKALDTGEATRFEAISIIDAALSQQEGKRHDG